MRTLNFLGLCGSLRRASYNRAALRAAQALAPAEVRLDIADLSAIPLYNEDLKGAGWPPPVAALREAVRTADAILFASPEYNYSISGVLKNAIDWVSRAPDPPFAGKAAGILGVSTGGFGTARSQYHLRQVGVFLDLHFVNKPEVLIGQAAERFDAQGELIHAPTREQIGKLLLALRDLAWQLRK